MIEGHYKEAALHEGEELDLSSEDSLPWLESDDEARTTGGVSTAQVAALISGLAAALVVVVGAVWYVSNLGSDRALKPDGSVIAAPEGPIRERPDDPGGRQFAGTGNVAPVVGEGGTQAGVMAVTDSELDDPENAAADIEPATDESAGRATGGVGVQLAAYRSRERAERGWRELRARTDALDGIDYRIVRGVVDIGTVYRLQAVRSTRAAGEVLCEALKADGLDCQVKS